MTTIIINERTAKGKSLIEFLKKFEGENFIKIANEENIPALDKSLKEASEGKVYEYKSIDELFEKLG